MLCDRHGPPSVGNLLITTCLHGTGRIAKQVELSKMEPAAGALFLLRRAGIIQRQATIETASSANRATALQIGTSRWAPLALDQAERLSERALAIREKALGLDHPDTAKTRSLYAALLQKRTASRRRTHDPRAGTHQ